MEHEFGLGFALLHANIDQTGKVCLPFASAFEKLTDLQAAGQRRFTNLMVSLWDETTWDYEDSRVPKDGFSRLDFTGFEAVEDVRPFAPWEAYPEIALAEVTLARRGDSARELVVLWTKSEFDAVVGVSSVDVSEAVSSTDAVKTVPSTGTTELPIEGWKVICGRLDKALALKRPISERGAGRLLKKAGVKPLKDRGRVSISVAELDLVVRTHQSQG